MSVGKYITVCQPASASGPSSGKEWRVYLLRCSDDSLYCGVTTDLERRLRQHNGDIVGGARYTQGRRPVALLWSARCESRSAAQQQEAALRRLSRQQKWELIAAAKGVDTA
jgi:putative endonuclease